MSNSRDSRICENNTAAPSSVISPSGATPHMSMYTQRDTSKTGSTTQAAGHLSSSERAGTEVTDEPRKAEDKPQPWPLRVRLSFSVHPISEHSRVPEYWESDEVVTFGPERNAETLARLSSEMPVRGLQDRLKEARDQWAHKTRPNLKSSGGWRGILFIVDDENHLLIIPRLTHERLSTLSPFDLRARLKNCFPYSLLDLAAQKKNEKSRRKGQLESLA